ncbi:aspartate--tRNA ligase [Patescibacteria group bacterium]|nr:aspartate--tRNA ligase [Patescibacteria group bacterium]
MLEIRTYTKDTVSKVGETIKLQGFVANIRNHGQLIFIDFRDWYGLVQVVVNKELNSEVFSIAEKVGIEYVVEIEGQVVKRQERLVNKNLMTGEIEVICSSLKIVNTCDLPPFPIDTPGTEIDEALRLKYRFLDLRRNRIADIVKNKHKYILAVRNWMDKNGFTEVITPLLTSTSPEGARDFIIPSRVHKGKFFVLPQAPQQFKQLLMVGGVDRYFQIAPCARDEDPRADRHAGVFYQIDIEISFPTIDIIFDVAERLMRDTVLTVAPQKKLAVFPFPRITYKDAMDKYGCDKPDLRFGLELKNVTELLKGKSDFNIFNNAEEIKCLVAENCGKYSRKDIEKLESLAKEKGAKGLISVKVENGLFTGRIGELFSKEIQKELLALTNASENDLVLFVADSKNTVNKVLSSLRNHLGDVLGLRDPNILSFAWITGFPFYEINDEGKLDFGHNPFSMPKGGIESIEKLDPLAVESYQYDLTLNGFELASGSIRNHEPETLVKVFEKIGYSREDILNKFGGMYRAFHFGAPPHGGWAIGIDRLLMILLNEANIRDIYAFPLSANGTDLLMNAPSEVTQKQLDETGIMLKPEK